MYTSSHTFANCSYLQITFIWLLLYNKSLFPFITSFSSSAFTRHQSHAKLLILRQFTALETHSANVVSSKSSLQRCEISISTLQVIQNERRANRHSIKSNTQFGLSLFQCSQYFHDNFHQACHAPFEQKRMIKI